MSAYAVVDGKYLLPLDKAVEVVKLLAEAEGVASTWDDKTPWRADGSVAPKFAVVSAVQYAALKLL